MACVKTTEQVTAQCALRTSYLCKHTTGNWMWKLFRLDIQACAYALCVRRQRSTAMGSSWAARQTCSRSLYSSHLNRLRLQLRRSHQPVPPASDGCPCPNTPAHEV